jgi:ribosomal protein L20
MLEQFEQAAGQALAELEHVQDLKALEDFRIKYLGRKGLLLQLLSEIAIADPQGFDAITQEVKAALA